MIVGNGGKKMSMMQKISSGQLLSKSKKKQDIPEFTVTMLGSSGSGKTVYMHAFSELFRYSNVSLHKIEGIGDTLEEKIAQDEKLRNMSWTRILQDNRGQLVMPRGTVDREEWQFQLTHANQPMCKFNWIDYRGGSLDEFSEGTDEAKFLMNLLSYSDAIILFIDSIPLFYYEDKANRLRWSGADTITGIINSYSTFQNSPEYLQSPDNASRNKERHLAISVVLSKCDSDLIDESVRKVDFIHRNRSFKKAYAGLVMKFMEDCNELLQILANNLSVKLPTGINVNWYPAIIPVGAFGEGYTKTGLDGNEGEEIEQTYLPAEEEELPAGNSLGRYFHPFNPPILKTEFSPPNPREFYPSPSNAASPLLWSLDKLLQAERRKGLFKKKGMFNKFSSWVSGTVGGNAPVEINTPQSSSRVSTQSVVESAVIFPVNELM